jgi:catechol 2,3-dioxygenase-like lactoylglutathione lyase family enzyme
MPTAINLVVIRSADIDKSAELYSVLGLVFTKHSHGSGPQHYASEMDNLVFEIYPVQKESEPSIGARIGFRVYDVDDTAQRLQDAGARLVSPPKDSPWGRRAVLADLDGHKLEITGQ